ncbi:MAG: apolipoprotein N-acyltransferase [Candidatus Cloacimonetes bacterium]|nr:apolipoprotein N-acyltransferase [Candidatus Cloacimonadota bacterium]
MPALLWVVFSAILISLSRLPIHLGWLVLLGWIPLLHYLQKPLVKLWAAAAVFAAIYIGTIFYWIAEVTPGGLIGIGIVYFLFYWLAFYLIRRIGNRLKPFYEVGFISVLLSFEYLQNFGETRFPWFHNAYSLSDYTILIQTADLGGVILISGLILLINVLIYKAIRGKYKALVTAGFIMLAWFAYGYYCLVKLPLQKHQPKISIMQPSIPQDVKWDQAFYETILQRYEELCIVAAKDSTHLIIFPEAAIPVYLMHDQFSMMRIQQLSQRYNLEIFTGFPHFEPAPPTHVDEQYFYNAAALIKPDGRISNLYYKNILVPIGERMLWLDKIPWLWNLQFGQANWEFGKSLAWMESDGLIFSPSICYEIAFAGLNQQMAIPLKKHEGSPQKSDFLVNITNDAWFGTSYGPWLHAVMTKFRAVESRIQIYRSANTGISMIVSPLGEVISSAPLFKVTNITSPLYTTPKIPLYRHIVYYPMLFVCVALGLFIISLLYGKQRKL